MGGTLERMGVYSLVINMGLVALKLGLAAFSGSQAQAASATDARRERGQVGRGAHFGKVSLPSGRHRGSLQ